MAWTSHEKVVDIRRRFPAADVAVATIVGFQRHITSRNAAALAYYALLTIFPLMLAATTVLGLVLRNRPQLRADIVDSAVSQIPVFGSQIANAGGDIGGSWWTLVVGLMIALWGSLKAFVGLQVAFDDSWDLTIEQRSNGFVQRGRALIGIAVIGLSQVGLVALSAIVSEAELPQLSKIGIVVGSFAINVSVLATMYRYLTSKDVTWSMVWPGALLTGAVYTVLQMIGTKVMTQLAGSESVYGDFGSIIAVLGWFSLHALVALIGAELNTAIEYRRLHGPAADPDISVEVIPADHDSADHDSADHDSA